MKLLLSVGAVLALVGPHSAKALSIGERSVAAILSAPAATAEVWPGFSLPERDWAVQDETGVYLVTRATPPSSFTSRGRWYHRSEPLPDFNAAFELQYRLGDLRVVAVRAARTVEETVSLLYHESFHVFQHAWEKEPAFDYAKVGDLRPAQAANIEVERRILREAIRRTTPDPALVRRALAVRARRATEVDPNVVRAERQAERHEGLAAYVEARSLALAFGRSRRAVAEDIGQQLSIPMGTFGGSPDERLIRTRGYGTGAAMGLILDGLGVDWKPRVMVDPLDRILAEAAGPPDASVADEAYRRYGYERLLRESPWGSLEVLTETAFDRLAPYRLVLDLPSGARIGWSLSSSATRDGGMHRPSPGILLLPMVKSLAVNHEGVSMTVEQRPVKVTGAPTGVERTRVTVLLTEPPTLNGQRLGPDITATHSDFRIVGRGVTVTIAGAARVITVADRITVVR